MTRLAFERNAFDDFAAWATHTHDKKVYKRIVSLISDTLRQPYEGIGKPEALKHELQGWPGSSRMIRFALLTKFYGIALST